MLAIPDQVERDALQRLTVVESFKIKTSEFRSHEKHILSFG